MDGDAISMAAFHKYDAMPTRELAETLRDYTAFPNSFTTEETLHLHYEAASRLNSLNKKVSDVEKALRA